jgi:hypothetical protein
MNPVSNARLCERDYKLWTGYEWKETPLALFVGGILTFA